MAGWLHLISTAYVLCVMNSFVRVNASLTTVVSKEKDLIKGLLDNYAEKGQTGRPVSNASQTMTVRMELALVQLVELSEKQQILTTNVWHRYYWTDVFLKWDPNFYGGVKKIRVPIDKIWRPDIILYNSVGKPQDLTNAMAVISYDGHVMWIPGQLIQSSCQLKINNFPYDTQECHFKYGSWTYDGFQLDLVFENNKTFIDLSEYVESSGWEIVGHPAVRNTIYYPCCPEPYPDLTFTLRIKRKAAFYAVTLILPCKLLSILTLVIFWLPGDSSEKINLGLNSFLSFFLLLLILVDSMPQSANVVPLLGLYISVSMIIIAVSIFLSVIIMFVSTKGERGTPMPEWMRFLILGCIGRVVCKCPPKRELTKKKKMEEKLRKHKEKHRVSLTSFEEAYEREFFMRKQKLTASQNNSKIIPGAGYQVHNANSVQSDQRPVGKRLAKYTSDCGDSRTSLSSDENLYDTSWQLTAIKSSTDKMEAYFERLMERHEKKDMDSEIVEEWNAAATVLDRVLFVIYLTVIVLTLYTIFPTHE